MVGRRLAPHGRQLADPMGKEGVARRRTGCRAKGSWAEGAWVEMIGQGEGGHSRMFPFGQSPRAGWGGGA